MLSSSTARMSSLRRRPDEVARLRPAASVYWFDEIAAAHLPALRARAAQMCRGRSDPDDLVQDALMRAFVARDQMRDPDRARSWLLTIVTNTFLDSLRRRRGRPGEVALDIDPAAPEIPPAQAWEEVTLEDIRHAVERLPEDVRDTYRMFALEGKGYNHIAAELGVPKATVGTRISRARKRLRRLLLDSHGGTHDPA